MESQLKKMGRDTKGVYHMRQKEKNGKKKEMAAMLCADSGKGC